MDAEERAKRKAAIQAIREGYVPQRSTSDTRLLRKSYVFPKVKTCATSGCKTLTFGGFFCTACASPVQKTALFEKTNQSIVPVVVDNGPLVIKRTVETYADVSSPKQIGPIGIAVVCLMVVLSLVAAYAQKHEDLRSTESIVTD